MPWSIFGSKDTELKKTSKEISRWTINQDDPWLAQEAARELSAQGWEINEMCETDADGFPTRRRPRGNRR